MTQPKDAVADDHRPRCPWCEYQHEDGWEWDQSERECSECGRPFEVERETLCVYHTKPMAKCPACERLVTIKGGLFRLHYAPGAKTPCPTSRQKWEG